MTSATRIPDMEKLMSERGKEFPHVILGHKARPDLFLDQEAAAKKPVKATVDMEKIRPDEDLEKKVLPDYEHPLTDPYNEMDRYIKPSEYLKSNILPPMDQIYYIDYNLSLDIRGDAVSSDNHTPEYCLQFTRFGNISRVELLSLIVSHHHVLLTEPYLFVDIKEIEGRCHLSNGKRTFGKIVSAKRDGHIVYVPEECIQTFSKPIQLERLTLSFCDHQGTPINIREIKVDCVRKGNDLTIECINPHFLQEREKVEVQIIKPLEIDSYEVEVKSVIDEKRFKIKNSFADLTTKIRIFRTSIVLSATFKLSEINWFILNDSSVQTSQLIKLSQMIKEKNQSISTD